MKKIFTLIAFIAMTITMSAQNFETDYTYGFWSNWSVGAGLQYSKNFTDNWKFGEGSNLGVEVRAQKQLGLKWDMRIIGSVPGIFTSDSNMFDRYATGLIGFSWSPWQHWYVFADGGLAVKRASFNWIALAADAGIGTRWNVRDNSTIYGEIGIDCVADITTDMTYNNVFIKVGWLYNYGITKTDQMILEQRKQLARDKEIIIITNDSVNNSLAECRKNEKELLKKIETLEKHDYFLTESMSDLSHNYDSLQNVINSIKENQLNYYAIPFSVLFDVDSYTINDSERAKIKAVASIMKDDTNVNYTVTGFCDKTGAPEYNQKLSEKRAEAVKKALMKYGVKEEQLTISGNGYEKPFSDAKLDVNRRVSFYRNF